MGELLLCSRELASVPYYIETVSLHVYSLEELCYYIKQNTWLLEPSFMEEELCSWIRTELKLPLLADRLQKLLREGGGLAEFVGVLAAGCSYLTADELQRIQQELSSFENKSEVECAKLRADRLLERKKYAAGLMGYRRLLPHPEVNGMLEGDIWHNMGTAYAGLFLFAEAADCYGKAYEKNRNPASMQQQKAALALAAGQTEAADDEPVNGSQGPEGEIADGSQGPEEDLLAQWKEEYLRSAGC